MNKTSTLKTLSALGKGDVRIAGGKGASLGELLVTGVNVPPGFVILSTTFDKLSKNVAADIEALLDKVRSDDIASVEEASEAIQAIIQTIEIPHSVQQEIFHAFDELECRFVAVRSSATAEDSAAAAWAGQLDTYLNTSRDNLLDNVKRCWSSLFTPRAIVYAFQKGLHKADISIAVVVQKMIDSECAGVAFSVHPVTQDPKQSIIEAGWGLGEALVAGHITPDSYVIDKSTKKIIDVQKHEQQKMLVRNELGGNEWRLVPKEKQEQQKLSETQVRALNETVIGIEYHYGFPCDIEWAYAENEFYILQSRPITTLREMKSRLSLPPFDTYQKLFQVGMMPYLISDIFSHHYRTLHVLLTFHDGMWISWLPRAVVDETLLDGMHIYGDRTHFVKYRDDFETYKQSSQNIYERILSNNNISKEDTARMLEQMEHFFWFYSKTEFFYTDKAAVEAETNKDIKHNFEEFEPVKNGGREFLNKTFFGESGYLGQLLSKLSKQHDATTDMLMTYSRDELLRLFDGERVGDDVLADRKRSYVFFTTEEEIHTSQGQEADSIVQEFLAEESEHTSEFHGIIANRGYAKGKAKVIHMSVDKYDQLAHIIDEMDKGDILVAETTSPEIMAACQKASAIVTNQGGMMSHAAIVSRELGIPCIVGTDRATKIIADGDIIEVDANIGVVRLISQQQPTYELYIRRDFSMPMLEIWHASEANVAVPFLNVKIPTRPHIIFERRDGTVASYYNSKSLPWLLKELVEHFKNNPKQLGVLGKEIRKRFEPLRDIYENPRALSREKLLKYLYSFERDVPYAVIMWLLCGLDDEKKKGLHLDELEAIRTATDKLSAGTDQTIRLSLEKLYPQLKELSAYCTIKEIEQNLLPPTPDLQERQVGFVWVENSLLKNRSELEQRNIELPSDAQATTVVKGICAQPGKARGKVRRIMGHDDIASMQTGEIVISPMTMPDFLPAMLKAKAIITDEGGLTCHAAIVARELRIPCIVGTGNCTTSFENGEEIEVDADAGEARKLRS